MTSKAEEASNGSSSSEQDSTAHLVDPASISAGPSITSYRGLTQSSSSPSSHHGGLTGTKTPELTTALEGQEGSIFVQPMCHPDHPNHEQPPEEQQEQQQPLQEDPHSPPKITKGKQSLITKALLSYINFFRVVQPLASLASLATISPVLAYFRSQTIFPVIHATLYVYTATLATCSVLFSLIYLVAVIYHKPLFWPFTNKHFRRTSIARIGGDMIICMVFCGLWFLSLVGLLIDTLYVDCSKVSGLSVVILMNHHHSLTQIKTVCYLERATFGLAVVSWACWMGVLLVLFYGHFWKRRQVIAERLRERLARRRRQHGASPEKGKKPVTNNDNAATVNPVPGVESASENNDNGAGIQAGAEGRDRRIDSHDCQGMDGEVGLTGIICRYDDETSTLGAGADSRRESRIHPSTPA
ncbi:hypothetical protein BGZ92_001088 [Podila epicladia]|nr:hypothetical protein BGZ92_001088 [Podila epicladia]